MGQQKIIQEKLKSIQALLCKATGNLKEREQQWTEEKFWLNRSFASKEQEVVQFQIFFKDLERQNQKSYQVNQSQQIKIKALENLNQELQFEDQLQFNHGMVNGNADYYWLSKRTAMDKEMKNKTADIQRESIMLKLQNNDLFLDFSSKAEESTKLKRKFYKNCRLNTQNEAVINDLVSEKIRLLNENQKCQGRLYQEDRVSRSDPTER